MPMTPIEPNPFEVLRLDPAATEEEIVRRAGLLRRRAADEATAAAVRRAVQALTARPEGRLLWSLLTHPDPSYQSPALDRFAAAFRRPPSPSADAATCPPLDLEEFTALVRRRAAEELELPPQELEPVGNDETAEEIDRQTAEALWQSLLFDPRA
jgi:hypothetical protein